MPAMAPTPLPPSPEVSGGRAWHRLDALTRLVVAVGTMVAALLLAGVGCLLLLAVLAVGLPAVAAGELRSVLRLGTLLAFPLAFSVVIVSLLFTPGTLADGAWLAAVVVARVVTMAGAAVLFYRTTRAAELVSSLQHHGASARLTFVIHNGVAMIPRLAERAGEVTEAQRARGLDTGSGPLGRARGVVALAAPTVLGALDEVETRTLALETRGFTRPGRPTPLHPSRDGAAQRVGRWAVAGGLVALAGARLAGLLPC